MLEKGKRPRFWQESRGTQKLFDTAFLFVRSILVKRYRRARFEKASRYVAGPFSREESLALDRATQARESAA